MPRRGNAPPKISGDLHAPAGKGLDSPLSIVLAAFGTTDPEAVKAVIAIKDRVSLAFPGAEVRLSFTSGFIRRAWRKRANEPDFRAAHPDLPEYIYHCLSPLSVLAELQENGPRRVLVQSLHVADGVEFQDLAAVVTALASITPHKASAKPFPALALGPPALGCGTVTGLSNSFPAETFKPLLNCGGALPLRGLDDAALERAAEALGHLAMEAKEKKASLILMGHGHEDIQQSAYSRLAEIMRRKYGPRIHIGLVEGSPDLRQVLAEAEKAVGGPARAILAPLMVVAGDHAKNDLAGEGEDSWAQAFKARGWQVECRLDGLGHHPAWAEIYINSLREMLKSVI